MQSRPAGRFYRVQFSRPFQFPSGRSPRLSPLHRRRDSPAPAIALRTALLFLPVPRQPQRSPQRLAQPCRPEKERMDYSGALHGIDAPDAAFLQRGKASAQDCSPASSSSSASSLSCSSESGRPTSSSSAFRPGERSPFKAVHLPPIRANAPLSTRSPCQARAPRSDQHLRLQGRWRRRLHGKAGETERRRI